MKMVFGFTMLILGVCIGIDLIAIRYAINNSLTGPWYLAGEVVVVAILVGMNREAL